MEFFHVTWVTHCARFSERMFAHKVRTTDGIWLDYDSEVFITKCISNILHQNSIDCFAYNICGDHVHILIDCEFEKLSNIVRKLKGKSSQMYKEYLKIPSEESFHLWAQKFHKRYIGTEEQFCNTVDYIINNREKHGLSPSNKLKSLILQMISPYPF